MQYYTFELDKESKDLCTITTPIVLYCYAHLPMGITVSPDIAQEIMSCELHELKDVIFYINDIDTF